MRILSGRLSAKEERLALELSAACANPALPVDLSYMRYCAHRLRSTQPLTYIMIALPAAVVCVEFLK